MKKCIFFLLIICLAGCKEDMPEPESFGTEVTAEAATISPQDKTDVTVRHIVQGSHVYVECIAPGITFTSGNSSSKKGKIVVSVDGKRFNEYHTAAFVIKGLKKGIHHVKLEILSKDNKSLGLKKQFYITIP
jgi:hypothetical protein